MSEYLVNLTFTRHSSYKKGQCNLGLVFNKYWNEWGSMKRKYAYVFEPFIIYYPFI